MDNKSGRWLRVEAVTSRTDLRKSGPTHPVAVNLAQVIRIEQFLEGTIFRYVDMEETVTVEDFEKTCLAIMASES